MAKVDIIELMKDNEPIGFTPIIRVKGDKPRGIMDGDLPINFPTKKEAKTYGDNYILENNL